MAEENKPATEGVSVELPAIFGVKAGMTRIFDENGTHVPVTVIKLVPNVISQVKTKERDGYEAYQVAYYEKREKLVNKPTRGHLAKASINKPLSRSTEVRVEGVDTNNLGKEVAFGSFTASTIVDVTGVSKGKGFQGVMKRYNFRGGPAAHGSCFHRAPGSIGNRATPGRVFKNKRLPGQMGNKTVTTQNIQVVELNEEKGYLLLKGSVPGAKNSWVKVTKAVKS